MENKDKENHIDFSDFNKNLNEPLSEKEQATIRQWLENNPKATDNDLLLNQQRMAEIGKEMFSHIETKLEDKQKGIRRIGSTNLWLAAASVALLLVSLSWFFVSKNYDFNSISYENNTGHVQKIYLPDGTVVWLNKNTAIEYPKEFEARSRSFYLKKGEAFFDVKRDTTRPFRIQAPDFDVTVLGTSFNIKVLENTPFARVTVATGKVKVSNGGGESGILLKNDQLEINKKDGRFSLRQIPATEANAWRNGQVFLQDVPFQELIGTLEETYGVKISYPHEILDKQKSSLEFNAGQSLESLLQIMEKVYDLRYEVKGKEVIFELSSTAN